MCRSFSSSSSRPRASTSSPKTEIYTLVGELTEKGVAVILISSDLLELIGLSDRILTLYERRITGEILRGGLYRGNHHAPRGGCGARRGAGPMLEGSSRFNLMLSLPGDRAGADAGDDRRA